MPRSSFSSSVINDDSGRWTSASSSRSPPSSRPFALWADPVTHHMEVVTEGDRPVNPRAQRLRAR